MEIELNEKIGVGEWRIRPNTSMEARFLHNLFHVLAPITIHETKETIENDFLCQCTDTAKKTESQKETVNATQAVQ